VSRRKPYAHAPNTIVYSVLAQYANQRLSSAATTSQILTARTPARLTWCHRLDCQIGTSPVGEILVWLLSLPLLTWCWVVKHVVGAVFVDPTVCLTHFDCVLVCGLWIGKVYTVCGFGFCFGSRLIQCSVLRRVYRVLVCWWRLEEETWWVFLYLCWVREGLRLLSLSPWMRRWLAPSDETL